MVFEIVRNVNINMAKICFWSM